MLVRSTAQTLFRREGDGFPTQGAVSDLVRYEHDIVAGGGKREVIWAGLPGQGVFRQVSVTSDAGLTTSGQWERADSGITGITAPSTSFGVFDSVSIRFAMDAKRKDVLYAGVIGSETEGVVGRAINSRQFRLRGLFRMSLSELETEGSPASPWLSLAQPTSVHEGKDVGIHLGGQGLKNFSLSVDPADSDVVYIGGDRHPATKTGRLFLGRFQEGAMEWGEIVLGAANGTAPHADSRGMVMLPAFDDLDLPVSLLQTDDGGIYRLLDPASPIRRRWQSANGNLEITEVVSVSYDPIEDVIIAGTQDNGTFVQSTAGSLDWDNSLGGDGNTTRVVIVRDNNGDAVSTTRYISTNDPLEFKTKKDRATEEEIKQTIANGMRVLKSDGSLEEVHLQGKRAFADGQSEGDYVTFGMAIHPHDSNRFLLGRFGLYESSDAGATISSQTIVGKASRNSEYFRAVAFGGSEGEVAAYASFGGKIGVREPTQSSFVLSRFRQLSNAKSISDIVVDPNDWKIAYAADPVANNVYGTVDGGKNWHVLSQNLKLQQPSSLELAKLKDARNRDVDVLLVGGVEGVFRAFNPAEHVTGSSQPAWSEFGAALPNAIVKDISYTPAMKHRAPDGALRDIGDVLVVGTLGRGVWKIANASQSLTETAELRINSEASTSAIRVEYNENNPLLLDVFMDGDNVATTPTANGTRVTISTLSVIRIDLTASSGRSVTVTVPPDLGLSDGIVLLNGDANHHLRLSDPRVPVVITKFQQGDGFDQFSFSEPGDLLVQGNPQIKHRDGNRSNSNGRRRQPRGAAGGAEHHDGCAFQHLSQFSVERRAGEFAGAATSL